MTANVIVPETGSRRLTRLIEEQSIGVTPSGNWSQLRNTGGDGVGSTINTTASNELSGSGALGQRDQIVTGRDGTFAYSAELSYDPTFDLLFESLLQAKFGDVQADELVPGQTDVTMTLEDELLSVKEFEFVRGARLNSLAVTINANEIITCELAGAGTDPGIVSQPVEAGRTFTGNDIDTTGITPAPVAGDFVQITNAATPSDNGYYRIASATATSATVDGTLAGISGDCQFSGRSLSEGETTNPKGTNTPMSAGNAVDLELSDDAGVNWYDSLVYGWRVPTLTANMATEVSDLREITESAAYVQLPVNRPINVQFQWHVINLQPLRWLESDQEFGLRFKMADPAGNFYRFEYPRCKFAEGSKGPAQNAQEMAGTSNLVALLDTNDVNVRIVRNVI